MRNAGGIVFDDSGPGVSWHIQRVLLLRLMRGQVPGRLFPFCLWPKQLPYYLADSIGPLFYFILSLVHIPFILLPCILCCRRVKAKVNKACSHRAAVDCCHQPGFYPSLQIYLSKRSSILIESARCRVGRLKW